MNREVNISLANLLAGEDVIGYFITEQKNFTIVAHKGVDKRRLELLGESSERILAQIKKMLDGLVQGSESNKCILLWFNTGEEYFDYLTSKYPDYDKSVFSTSGLLVELENEPLHIVLPPQELGITESMLSHELTKYCLNHLDLPIWLEEGIESAVEYELTGYPTPATTESELAILREYWTPERIQGFWDGSKFYDVEESGEISRATAELLVYVLLKEFDRDVFIKFVSEAKYIDSGQESAIGNLGIGLGDLVAVAVDTE